MAWQNTSIFPLVIVQSGAPNTGLFLYNGVPGPGNPPIAWDSTASSDPFGNVITPAAGLNGLPLLAYGPGGAQVVQYLTGSGNFVAPAGVTQVYAECWGAGHNGGAGASTALTPGGAGGGAGEYAAEPALAVTPGNSYAFSQGITAGASSSFAGDSVTVTAHGGTAGHAGAPGVNSTGGAGGTGSTNTIHHPGGNGGTSSFSQSATGGSGGGSSGGPLQAGNNGANSPSNSGPGGAGGAPVSGGGAGGGGGTGANGAPTAGIAGVAPGGGGGGGGSVGGAGGSGAAGGAFAAGQIRLTYSATNTLALLAALAPIAGTDNQGNTYGPGLLVGRQQWLVPSGDTSGITDTANINNALAAGRSLWLAPGNFFLNNPLTPPTNSSIVGAGGGATVLTQQATAQEGITATNKSTVTLRGFTLVGAGSGVSTAAGVHFASNPPTANIILDDIIVQSFGRQGFLFDSVFLTELRKCEALQNGGDGFQVTNSFAVPTSFSFHSCYANANLGTYGYELDALQYSSLSGCAADGNATGYGLLGCQGVTLTSCGTEAFTATGYLFNNCRGCGLYGGFTFNGKTKVAWVTNGTTRQTIGGLTETSPAAGATACVQTDAATSSILWGITHVTADSLTAGTFTNVDGSA